MTNLWTIEEKQFIKDNYEKMTDAEMAKSLGRTYPSVHTMRMKLGIRIQGELLSKRLATLNGLRMDKEHNPNWKGGISKDHVRYKKRFREKYPEKARAHDLVAQAIRSNKLVRLPCETCGDKNVHAHHKDYSKPFQVTWLCPPCHRSVHYSS